MKHLFLTGPVGVGKSTVLRRYLQLKQGNYGGFQTVWHKDTLYLQAYGGGDFTNPVAVRGDGCCRAIPGVFDEMGPKLLRGDRLVMDELGFLEGDSPQFQAAVLAALTAAETVVGVIKPAHTLFLEAVRTHPRVCVVEVTAENRDILPTRLLEEF